MQIHHIWNGKEDVAFEVQEKFQGSSNLEVGKVMEKIVIHLNRQTFK